jgi:hypothetical protein
MNTTKIGAVLLSIVGLAAGQGRQAAGDPLLPPDPAMQAGFRRVLAAESAEEQRRELAALRASAGPAHGLLVPQLFLFSSRSRDTREAMLLAFVLAELRIPGEDVIRALVPLLETDDRALRTQIGNVLSEYEHRSIDRGADFTPYRALLEQGLPLGLVRHLVETDPNAALLALARAEVSAEPELRALLWAEHEVADALWKLRHGFVARDELARAAPEALAQMELLSAHARWWARACAAAIAGAEPGLLPEARLAALERDEHPLVRELAAAAREARR